MTKGSRGQFELRAILQLYGPVSNPNSPCSPDTEANPILPTTRPSTATPFGTGAPNSRATETSVEAASSVTAASMDHCGCFIQFDQLYVQLVRTIGGRQVYLLGEGVDGAFVVHGPRAVCSFIMSQRWTSAKLNEPVTLSFDKAPYTLTREATVP